MIFLKRAMPLLITASLAGGLTACANNGPKDERDLISMKSDSNVKNVSGDKSARFNVEPSDSGNTAKATNEVDKMPASTEKEAMPKWEAITKTVYFEFDSDSLNEAAMRELKSLPELSSAKNTTIGVKVIGYTDAMGDESYNKDLSRRRAESVKDALNQIIEDVDLNVETLAKGEAEPISSNQSASGREKNRRVEIIFTQPAYEKAKTFANK